MHVTQTRVDVLPHPVAVVLHDDLLHQLAHPVLQVEGHVADAALREAVLRPSPESLDRVEGAAVDAVEEKRDVV